MILRIFPLVFALVLSCSRQSASNIPKLLDALDCDKRSVVGNLQLAVETEAKDRGNYHPLSAEVIPIKMRKPIEGYHGPTQGSYIFIIEQYPDPAAAAKRVKEYRINGWDKRLPNPSREELDDKSSVRCWALADGNRAWLLTTHAAIFSALEDKTGNLKRKLLAYLGKSQ